MNDFQQDRMLIDETLAQYLATAKEPYQEVLEAMHYAVMNGGKRIRPILAMEFCRMFGGDVEAVLPFACAVEMIHSYSLVHDDLPCMDDDDLRRGKPSCHKKYGEATALLAGDGLLTLAFSAMANAPLANTNPKAVLKCMQLLSEQAGIHGMIGGQVMDLAMEGKPVSKEQLSQMHLLKTGALIKAACQMGVACADGDQQAQTKASLYGAHLGLAFQLVDDLLDVVGTEEELGKPIGSDQENEKMTFITLCGMGEASQMATYHTDQAIEILRSLPESNALMDLTHQLLARRN